MMLFSFECSRVSTLLGAGGEVEVQGMTRRDALVTTSAGKMSVKFRKRVYYILAQLQNRPCGVDGSRSRFKSHQPKPSTLISIVSIWSAISPLPYVLRRFPF